MVTRMPLLLKREFPVLVFTLILSFVLASENRAEAGYTPYDCDMSAGYNNCDFMYDKYAATRILSSRSGWGPWDYTVTRRYAGSTGGMGFGSYWWYNGGVKWEFQTDDQWHNVGSIGAQSTRTDSTWSPEILFPSQVHYNVWAVSFTSGFKVYDGYWGYSWDSGSTDSFQDQP